MADFEPEPFPTETEQLDPEPETFDELIDWNRYEETPPEWMVPVRHRAPGTGPWPWNKTRE